MNVACVFLTTMRSFPHKYNILVSITFDPNYNFTAILALMARLDNIGLFHIEYI